MRAASRATALALCVLAVAAVAGCRRSAGDERLRRGDRLVTATISDPKTFNPLMSVDSASGAATNDLFEGLVRLNQRTTLPEPMLATSWEHDDAGTTWTFHLRPDVHWHDGEPFTAADVAFTFDAIYDPKVPNSLRHVLTVGGKRIDVEVVDPLTVRLRLAEPFAPLLNSIGFVILPKHVLGKALTELGDRRAAREARRHRTVPHDPLRTGAAAPVSTVGRVVDARRVRRHAAAHRRASAPHRAGSEHDVPQVPRPAAALLFAAAGGDRRSSRPRTASRREGRARRPRYRDAVRELQPQSGALRPQRPTRPAPRLVHRSEVPAGDRPQRRRAEHDREHLLRPRRARDVGDLAGEHGLLRSQPRAVCLRPRTRARAPHRGRLRRSRRRRGA